MSFSLKQEATFAFVRKNVKYPIMYWSRNDVPVLIYRDELNWSVKNWLIM